MSKVSTLQSMNFDDPKTCQILDAGIRVFGHYGFRKTSMGDIAAAAGMSRAALYLYFRNKEDIFRQGSIRMHEKAISLFQIEMGEEGRAFERISRGMAAVHNLMKEVVIFGEHIRELYDINMVVAADATEAAHQRMRAMMEQAIEEDAAAGRIDLAGATAGLLATTAFNAIEGIRCAMCPPEEAIVRITLLMRLMDAGLRTRA